MPGKADLPPWRDVMEDPTLHSGRGGLLGPDTNRRTRWWDLKLSCGHRTERIVRYRPRTVRERRTAGRTRLREDVLPAPRKVRCYDCRAEQRAASS